MLKRKTVAMGQHLEDKWKQAFVRLCHECQHTDQLSEGMLAKIKVLQRAASSIESAAEDIDSVWTHSENMLIERVRHDEDNMKLLLRYMILKDIIFKRSRQDLFEPLQRSTR